MRTIALFIIVFFPFLSFAQKDTIKVENGGIQAIAYPQIIAPTFISFDEKVMRVTSDTTILDSGSVRIVLNLEYDKPRIIGPMYFEHVKELLYTSFITAQGLESNHEYEFQLILMIGGKSEEKTFTVKTK